MTAQARENMGVNLGQGAHRRNTYRLAAGSVPPIYTKRDTLAYFWGWPAGPEGKRFLGALLGRAPRDRSCARREARRRVSFRAAREGRV